MAKQILEVAFISFILVTGYICTCSCTCDTTPETSVDDYIENISAHYKNEILMIEAQIAYMELAFNKELSIVAYNQELTAKIARQLESRMRSTAALTVKGKICVQHFMGNVSTENVNLQTKLRACVDAAKTNSKTIADGARNQLKNVRNHLHELMHTDLTLCRKNHGNNLAKLAECVRDKLKIREIHFNNFMKAAIKEVEGAMCRADVLARTAQECSFYVLLNTQSLLAETVSNINTCIGNRILEIK